MLNLASQRNSPDRSTKVRGSTYKVVPQFVNTGFQVLFHSPPGVLFTFPSQYYALSVTKEYLALGVVPRLPARFLVSRGTLDPARSRLLSYTGLSPSLAGFPKTILLALKSLFAVRNPSMHACWFRLLPFRSPLLWKSMFSFFSSGYLDVSVPRVPLHTLWIGVWIHTVWVCRFPHSEISGSKDICSSPKLFAAYHVFHRLLVPRHPPCALFLFDLPAPIAFGTVGITMRLHRAFRFIAFTMFDSPQASLPMVPRMSFPISNVNRYQYRYFRICGFQGTSAQPDAKRRWKLLSSSFFVFDWIACLHAAEWTHSRMQVYAHPGMFPYRMEMEGFEPLTPCLQGRCSPN